jgi:phage terminase large subunit GpA-like protein
LNGQGSADKLAKVRTRAFPNRKIYYVSTPTIEGQSLIWRKFKETDQNYFEVPCPFCGAFQVLKFENLVWEPGKPETVKYKCIHCDELIDESQKTEMLDKGYWVPSDKSKISKRKIGFHINSLYAPTLFLKWFEIVEEYEDAVKDTNLMKVFTNTMLGETWAEKSDAPKYENLYNRRETYEQNKVPNEVCFLTAGVDIQKDRIELEVVGWGKDKTSWSIDYRVLLGKTALPEVWAELGKVVYETWEREDGTVMNLQLMAVDSGYNTTEVYDFCKKYPHTKVIPTKGQDSLGMAIAPPKTIDYNRKGKKIGKTKVWNVGVSFLKHELYAWLGLEKENDIAPPRYCHFPQYDEHFFKGLTAEDWIPAKKKWHKRFDRNEPLDCRIYARAASVVVGLDRLKPEQIEAMYGKPREKEIKKSQRKVRKVQNSIWD